MEVMHYIPFAVLPTFCYFIIVYITCVTVLTSGQRILMKRCIAGGFFVGKIYCDTWQFLWPASRNAGWQRAVKFQCQGHWKQCFAEYRKSRHHPSQKCPIPMGVFGPHLIRSSLGAPESTSQVASRSV